MNAVFVVRLLCSSDREKKSMYKGEIQLIEAEIKAEELNRHWYVMWS